MERHSILREGAIAGVIGATSVALWFLIVDVASGHALFTPNLLGTALLSVLGPAMKSDSLVFHVAFYTVFHYAAFIALGTVAAVIMHQADRNPTILAGALILFVAFELGFYGLTALLSQSEILGSLAWYQIGLANLIAAMLMGVYLWRAHPAARHGLDLALSGGE